MIVLNINTYIFKIKLLCSTDSSSLHLFLSLPTRVAAIISGSHGKGQSALGSWLFLEILSLCSNRRTFVPGGEHYSLSAPVGGMVSNLPKFLYRKKKRAPVSHSTKVPWPTLFSPSVTRSLAPKCADTRTRTQLPAYTRTNTVSRTHTRRHTHTRAHFSLFQDQDGAATERRMGANESYLP